MPVEKTPAVKPFLAQAPKKEEVEQKVAQAQKEIKDGKKKLALTLGGLATLGVVTAGVIYGIKTGKFGKVKQEAQEQGQKAIEKIKGLIKGDDIPFEKGKIEKLTDGDEEVEIELFKKYFGKYNGQEVLVEHKFIDSQPYALINNRTTGELIEVKRLECDGCEMSLKEEEKAFIERILNLGKNTQNIEVVSDSTIQGVPYFDSAVGIKRYQNGIGESVRAANDGSKTTVFYEPDSAQPRSYIRIFCNENKDDIITENYASKRSSLITMKKDTNGNVVEVINHRYNNLSKDNGGQKIVTTIQRDETGKVIGSNRVISEIEAIKPNDSNIKIEVPGHDSIQIS